MDATLETEEQHHRGLTEAQAEAAHNSLAEDAPPDTPGGIEQSEIAGSSIVRSTCPVVNMSHFAWSDPTSIMGAPQHRCSL